VIRYGESPTEGDVEPVLDVTWYQRSEDVVVRARGEIDLTTRALLDSRIRQAEQAAGSFSRLVVDLRGVTFLSAAGLRVLLAARQRCVARGASVTVVSAHPCVIRPIELTNLAGPLGLVPELPALPTIHCPPPTDEPSIDHGG
jgi:anti-anti-sigma factor